MRESFEYLFDAFDALYRTLGESASSVRSDAGVVATYEAARLCGEVALALRAFLGEVESVEGPVARTLTLAREGGEALLLVVVVRVVGPRVLVSLLDARAGEGRTDAGANLLNLAETRLREAMARCARALVGDEVTTALNGARALEEDLERAGYVESFGLAR